MSMNKSILGLPPRGLGNGNTQIEIWLGLKSIKIYLKGEEVKRKKDTLRSISHGICVKQGKKNDYITKLCYADHHKPIWDSIS